MSDRLILYTCMQPFPLTLDIPLLRNALGKLSYDKCLSLGMTKKEADELAFIHSKLYRPEKETKMATILAYEPFNEATADIKDKVAHTLCQIIDDDAPLRWTRYRFAAGCIAGNKELMSNLIKLGETK